MTEDRNDKAAWRNIVGGIFAVTPASALADLAPGLNKRLGMQLETMSPATLLAFSPLPDEPDIRPVLRWWLKKGGVLALPIWHGGRTMEFMAVGDLDRDLVPGRGGIAEPRSGLAGATIDASAVALVPGRAFSESRTRLGRGAGCYDAFFAARELFRIGVCFDFQVFPVIPASGDDIAMDMVLTPGRTI